MRMQDLYSFRGNLNTLLAQDSKTRRCGSFASQILASQIFATRKLYRIGTSDAKTGNGSQHQLLMDLLDSRAVVGRVKPAVGEEAGDC